MITHTKHHLGLVDVVFKSQKSEAIADFLHAWTMGYSSPESAGEMVGCCTGRLVGLHNLGPFSPRLRRLVIRSVEIVGYNGFEGAGVERLVELLDHLHITAEEMDETYRWASLLLGMIQSSGGTQFLSDWYWELLVELAVSEPWWLEFGDTNVLKIARTLIDAEEWGKLECWIGTVWTVSEPAGIPVEDLEHSALLLFRQRPGAAQRLEQWIERWSHRYGDSIPEWFQSRVTRKCEMFQLILTRAHEAVQRQDGT